MKQTPDVIFIIINKLKSTNIFRYLISRDLFPLGFEAEIELEPEIILPRYKDIEVRTIPAGVDEAELQVQIDNLRKKFASLEPVEDGKAAMEGDFVTIDFVGKIEGREFEGGSAQDYSLEIGSKTLFPEFESSLAGMKKGNKNKLVKNALTV